MLAASCMLPQPGMHLDNLTASNVYTLHAHSTDIPAPCRRCLRQNSKHALAHHPEPVQAVETIRTLIRSARAPAARAAPGAFNEEDYLDNEVMEEEMQGSSGYNAQSYQI